MRRKKQSSTSTLARTNEEYIKALKRCVSLLKSYAEQFDNGMTDYALPMSVQLRLLFYNRGQSRSIIQEMLARKIITVEAQKEIPMACFTSGYTQEEKTGFVRCSLCKYFFTVSPDPAAEKVLHPTPIRKSSDNRWYYMPLSAWWEKNTVLLVPLNNATDANAPTINKCLSREDVVRLVANKEGGAHVDPRMSAELSALMRNRAKCLTIKTGDEIYRTQLDEILFAAIRTITEETLQTFSLIKGL